MAERWFATEVEPRLKHPEAVRRALDRHLVPKLGGLATDAVKPSDCAGVLDRVRTRYPALANDLLRYLRAIFAFAIRRHLVDGSPVGAFSARLDGGGKESEPDPGTLVRRVVSPVHRDRQGTDVRGR